MPCLRTPFLALLLLLPGPMLASCDATSPETSSDAVNDAATDSDLAMTADASEDTDSTTTPPRFDEDYFAIDAVHIGAGFWHSCYLGSTGELVCWGENRALADLADPRSTQAVPANQSIAPGGTFKALTTGMFHNCALDLDGFAVCWGDDRSGESSPPSGIAFAQISAGASISCGVTRQGRIHCWGRNADRLGLPDDELYARVAAGRRWNDLYGDNDVCALRFDGEIECWTSLPLPPAPSAGPWRQISYGGRGVCAVDASGQAECWRCPALTCGEQDYGQFDVPDGRFALVSTFNAHSCGIELTSGLAQCWGYDLAGSTAPPAVPLAELSVGGNHACGIGLDGAVVCWGHDFSGQVSSKPDTVP